MVRENKRPLKVFLCHASGDKPPVRDLYKRLTAEGVDAWLDKEKLLPGQDWRLEIPKAVREADVVVVCLSKRSITKEGYVQKEIKFALDIAEEKPEGTIFLIPARLEDCVVPVRLNRWQWVDLYEDDGFIKLLRSLKLRADAVDATVEPTSYVDTDKETDRKLEQWYTEGLAAFYTEDWDRACQRFQSILSERPNHRNASEKLEEAERQRNLSRLYEQASGAIRSENWGTAIQTLDELSNKSADYKDTAQLLRNARKQKQLSDLYTEAKALHVGKQWEAVVKVFEQISSIEPNYPDADGLLPSAQKEVAELKRVAELNEQYSHALREMDAGNWHEARRLLEAVHKSETGFLETEKLLKKVENEIVKEEQRRKQNDQINTLYEQAHGLLRSKKWRNALDKMGEIRKLDEHFPDTDGIAEKAQKELAREEQEAERQNKLAALYAEAVKLLKEEKYQEALDKWGEVRAIDQKYPDRQWVRRTAKKALAKQAKPISAKPKFVIPKSLWIGLGGVGAIAVLVFAINQFGNGENIASRAPTKTPLDSVVENVPQKTSTPRPATIIPTSLLALPEYDNFDDTSFDGSFNSTLWQVAYDAGEIYQKDGNLIFDLDGDGYAGLIAKGYSTFTITRQTSFEARMSLDTSDDGGVFMQIETVDGQLKYGCGIQSRPTSHVKCFRSEREGVFENVYNEDYKGTSWHTFRFTVEPAENRISYFMDGRPIGSHTSIHSDNFSNNLFRLYIQGFVNNSGKSIGMVDYVWADTLAIGEYADPTMYDNFNNPVEGGYNLVLWSPDGNEDNANVINKDGKLSFTVNDTKQFRLTTNLYKKMHIVEPFFFEAQLFLDPDTTSEFTHLLMSMEGDDKVTGDHISGSICGIFGSGASNQDIECWSTFIEDREFAQDYLRGIVPEWHIMRIEVYPPTTIRYVVDGMIIDEYEVPHPEQFDDLLFRFTIGMNMEGSSATGYFDNIRMGAIKDDPTIYDNFDDTSFDGKFDNSKWTYLEDFHYPDGRLYQEDGTLVFEQSGTEERWQFLRATKLDFYPVTSAYFESALKLDPNAKGGDVQLGFNSDYGMALCGLETNQAYCWCGTGSNHLFDERISVQSSSWQFYRIEVIPSEAKFTFYINGRNIGNCSLPSPTGALEKTAIFDIGGWMHSRNVKGYIDYIHIGPLE